MGRFTCGKNTIITKDSFTCGKHTMITMGIFTQSKYTVITIGSFISDKHTMGSFITEQTDFVKFEELCSSEVMTIYHHWNVRSEDEWFGP